MEVQSACNHTKTQSCSARTRANRTTWIYVDDIAELVYLVYEGGTPCGVRLKKNIGATEYKPLDVLIILHKKQYEYESLSRVGIL